MSHRVHRNHNTHRAAPLRPDKKEFDAGDEVPGYDPLADYMVVYWREFVSPVVQEVKHYNWKGLGV